MEYSEIDFHSHSFVQLVAAKIMEMGPVLVVNFQAQQIAYIADANGKVIEGDPVSSFLVG